MNHNSVTASVVMIAGLGITYLFLPSGDSLAIFQIAAVGAALALGAGLLLEAQGARSVRSLVRTDLLMIAALFGLTLLEFFFQQDAVKRLVSAESALNGVEALFLGFCGLIIGRHLAPRTNPVMASSVPVHWGPNTLFRIYLASLFAGYFIMLWSVGFDPVELTKQMLRPRFSQPWARGQYGGLGEMIGELGGLFRYLIPAIAGSVLARPSRSTRFQTVIVALGLLFTLFYGFTSGTRNVFLIYVLIFIVSYILQKPQISWKRVAVIASVGAIGFYAASYYMLQFRTVGLDRYVAASGDVQGYKSETLFIDYNLPVISNLTKVFPDRIDYLGLEFATYAALRPVPRAIWPGKPEELSITAERALGAKGLTLASTFVGEAYMMGGFIAVTLVGILFGYAAGWWNHLGSGMRSNASIILYAAGFFAAALSMRSMVFTTTAMIPVIAVWIYTRYSSQSGQRQPANRSRP